MEDALLAMLGAAIPSSTGAATYRIEDVRPGKYVVLTAASRKQPSVLDWADIELVYKNRPPGTLRTVDVHRILENPQFRHSAPMCALVLAILDPKRVQKAA